MVFNLTYKYSLEWSVTSQPLSASTHRSMDCILASRKRINKYACEAHER